MFFNKIISWLLAIISFLFPALGERLNEIPENEPPYYYDLNKQPVEPLSGDLAYKSYDYWLENADNYYAAIKNNPDEVFMSANSSSYAWNTSYAITALYKLYCFTNEIKYLELLSRGLDMMFSTLADRDGDGFLNWGCTEYSTQGKYEEYCVHAGVVLASIADYLCLVKGDTALGEKINASTGKTYREQADELIKISCDNIIAAFECDWSEQYGLYMNRSGSGNYNGKTEPASLPNNQYLSMASAMYGFAKINPEKSAEYLRRADRMIGNFKSKLKLYRDGTAKWFYHNSFFKGDIEDNIEDFSHAMFDIKAMTAAYSRGDTINLGNLRSIAATYEKKMAKGTQEAPVLSANVDGSGGASGHYFYHLFDLQSFGNVVWQRGERYLNYAKEINSCNAAYVLQYHPQAPQPAKPVVFIENGAGISSDFSVINWSAAQYAADYCLQIATDEAFTKRLIDRPYILENNAILTSLPKNQTVYLRVIARNESGCTASSETVTISTS